MTESLIDTLPSPTPGLEPGLIARLAADLGGAGWSVDAMKTMITPTARAALMRNQRVPAVRELQRKDSPGAVLTRFFVLGCAESGDVLAQALPTLGVRGAVDLGLIFPALDMDSPSGQQLFKANYDLRPHAAQLQGGLKNWWILSDLGEDVTGEPIRPDHVLGIGGATTSLLKETLRTPVESALDLGCGCGIQALYLATHATRVVATDLSSRACEITRFNAALNGVELDVRQGSLFEPVEGEEFDLIASNPPFVITPDSLRTSGVLEYRDGGMSRDHLVRTVIRESPKYLKSGGVVQLLANWEIPGRLGHLDDWENVVRSWVEDLPVDAWIVQRDRLDPAHYVEMWLRDSGQQLHQREDYEREYAQWLEDFVQAGVVEIGMGMVALRKLDTPRAGVCECDELEGGESPSGEDVQRALASLRLPDDLSGLHLYFASDVTEERHFLPGAQDPSALVLHQGGGLGQSVASTTALSALVGASDGELSVGQICGALAALLECDSAQLQDELFPQVRTLIRWGFLRVESDQE